jgi:hypothetical protein
VDRDGTWTPDNLTRLAQEQSLATLSLRIDQRPRINFDTSTQQIIFRPDPTTDLEPQLETLEQIREEHAQIQRQNQHDLIESQQPDSIVAINPYYIRQQQKLELQLLNQVPIVQDTPEPPSSSEQIESTSWDHTTSHSSARSPTECNYRNYPVEPPAILIEALENLQSQGIFRQPPEQYPDQDLEGLEYADEPKPMQDWDEQAAIPPPPPNPGLPLYHPENPQYQQYTQAVVPVDYPPPADQQPPPPPPRQMATQVAPTPRGADPKWPKLPIFDSSYKAYPSWKNQFKLYINGHPHHFANDAQKITWMLSYISGSPSAIAWVDEKR